MNNNLTPKPPGPPIFPLGPPDFTGKDSEGFNNSIANGAGRKALENTLNTRPEERPPLPVNIKHLQEEAILLWGGGRLREMTQVSPMKPLKGANVNDVYITNYATGEPNAVFKGGSQAALLAEVCFRLGRIVGIEHAVVPAKKGVAHVVSKNNLKIDHATVRVVGVVHNESREVVVAKKNMIPTQIAHLDKGNEHLRSTLGKKEYLLERQKNGLYKVCKAPLDQFVASQTPMKVCCVEKDETRTFYIINANDVYSIGEHKDQEVTSIGKKAYHLIDEGNHIVLRRGEDADPAVVQQKYLRMEIDDPTDDTSTLEVLVPASKAIPLQPDLGELEPREDFVFSHGGRTYRCSCGDDENDIFYTLEEEEEEESPSTEAFLDMEYLLVQTQEPHRPHNYFLTPQQSVLSKEIEGMVQTKIENTFHTPANKSTAMNLLADTPERVQFFANIDKYSFIECFIATILLRPQDGKIVDLSQSNVLFAEIPNIPPVTNTIGIHHKLRPIIIDNDETMPTDNTVSKTKKERSKENGGIDNTVHPVRNGLMGFPQANELLTEEERTYAEGIMKGIIAQRKAVEKYLNGIYRKEPLLFEAGKVTACLEVIDRMQAFLEKHPGQSWTLQQLFFEIFPEYKMHWDAIIKEESDINKAAFVGDITLGALKKYRHQK